MWTALPASCLGPMRHQQRQLTTSSSSHALISKEGSSCVGDTKDMKKGSDITLAFLVCPLASALLLLWLPLAGWAERKTLSLNLQGKVLSVQGC